MGFFLGVVGVVEGGGIGWICLGWDIFLFLGSGCWGESGISRNTRGCVVWVVFLSWKYVRNSFRRVFYVF